jgi:hypothetical protein
MKHIKILVSLLVVLGFIAFPSVGVKASGPAGSWYSGIACQNLDQTNAANVTLSFYPEMNGASAFDYPDTIAAGGSKNWATVGTTLPGFPSSFTGSGVVSSTTPLACSVNTASTGTGTTANPYRLGANMGLSDTTIGPVVYVPQAVHTASGINSYISVQNTGSAATAVHVRYYNTAGVEVAAAAETATIPANSTKIFYQDSNPGLGSDFNASAKVTADDGVTPLGVAVAIYSPGTDPSSAGFASLNGVVAGAAKVFVPSYIRNFIGYNSGMAIQNIGTSSTTATVVFTFVDTVQGIKTYTLTRVILPNQSAMLWAPSVPELVGVDSLIQKTGSAVVTVANPATDKVVITVNQVNLSGDAQHIGQSSSYNAINDGAQTNTVFFPQYVKWVANKLVGGLTISNTTGTAGTCTITYAGQPGATETGVVLPANGSFSRYSPNVTALPDGFNAAVKVQCTQPVVGIVNMAAANGKGNADVYGDSSTANAGINQ